MKIEILGKNVRIDNALRTHIEHELASCIDRCGTMLRRITVSLSDINGPRGGVNKQCRITLTIARAGQVVAEATELHYGQAIAKAVERVERGAKRKLQRRRTVGVNRLRHSVRQEAAEESLNTL